MGGKSKVDRIKINAPGLDKLRSAPEVASRINGILENVASTANAMDETPRTERGEEFGYEVSTWEPRRRAGGRVTAAGPTARRRNAENNTLLKALDQHRE